jgi:ATP-dependent protease ClpP protease subunit
VPSFPWTLRSRISSTTPSSSASFLTSKKKLSLDEIEKLMERDYFMGAKEALELGVVDEIP